MAAAAHLRAEPETEGIPPALVAGVTNAIHARNAEAAAALTAGLHPADIADLFEQIEPACRTPLARALGDRLDADVFAEMTDWVRDAVLDELDNRRVAEVVSDLDTDDAVALVEELDAEDAEEVLSAIDPADRVAIEEALAYPEESAGRIMRRDPIAAPEHWTAAQAIAFLRADASDTDFWELFVVSPAHHPVGTIRLSWLLTAPGGVSLADIMQREQTLIPADMDQEEVAYRFQQYALISAAVVDASGRLVGVITVDDIVHIVQQEASEDILRLSGAGDEGDVNEPIRETYKLRVRWLLANLMTALVASSIIRLFEDAIAQMVVLATLMPIVAGVGGNAGTQTLAVTVRALATRQLVHANASRQVARELRVALLNGATIAVVIGTGVSLVFGDMRLGAVIAAAMLTNIVVAGLAGVLVPLGLERAGVDPAVSSSIFVTMTTDSIGFLAFLGLASASGLVG